VASRWLGFGAGVVGLGVGLVGVLADEARPWAIVAGLAAALAGLLALVGDPIAPSTPARQTVTIPPGSTETNREDATAAFIDPQTGLFSEGFFAVAVANRIAAARRHLRPVSVVEVEIARGDTDPRPLPPILVGTVLEDTVREGDTACRLRDERIGLVLEDTTEEGAVVVVDRIRARLIELAPGALCWAGIACYPTHAFNAAEATDKATQALAEARTYPRDTVRVATGD
jgi:GGDEF domain-containing protein